MLNGECGGRQHTLHSVCGNMDYFKRINSPKKISLANVLQQSDCGMIVYRSELGSH